MLVYNKLGGKEMNYSNYGMDDVLIRTFMSPAVPPTVQPNMQNKGNKFVNPSEGFLRGNMQEGTYVPYKNMTYIRPTISDERQALLYQIQEAAFAAHELNLYLDTHPNDSEAIRMYVQYNNQEKKLNDEYERKYGPIDLSDDIGLNMTPWAWIKEPWPWSKQ